MNAFVDGSGWEGVYVVLTKNGYNVSIVQNPTTSLADDVAVTKRTIAAQRGPVVLVGHSYGGVVVTEAGNHPNVKALAFIAAFAPDKGESVSSLISNPPPGAPVPPILPPRDGYLFLDRSKFADAFAADVDAEKAAAVDKNNVANRRHCVLSSSKRAMVSPSEPGRLTSVCSRILSGRHRDPSRYGIDRHFVGDAPERSVLRHRRQAVPL